MDGAFKRLLMRGARAASGPWTPATLLSGQQGDWWDATQISTLSQDTGGATPVAADNDPVGRFVGRVNSTALVQYGATTTRPVYRSSNQCIVGDGTDDALMTASNFSVSGYPHTLVVLFDQSVNGASGSAVCSLSAAAGDYTSIVLNTPGGSRASDRAAATVNTSPLVSYPAGSGLAAAFAKFATGAQEFKFNRGSTSTSTATNTHAAGRFILGALRQSAGTPSLFSAFRIQQIIAVNKITSAAEDENILTYWGL